MNLHDQAAGPTYFIKCKLCNKMFEVYDRSFYGTGKKCPGCGFVHSPANRNTYEKIR